MNKTVDRFVYPDSYLDIGAQFEQLFLQRTSIIAENFKLHKNRKSLCNKYSDLIMDNFMFSRSSAWKKDLLEDESNSTAPSSAPPKRDNYRALPLPSWRTFFIFLYGYIITKFSITIFLKLYLEHLSLAWTGADYAHHARPLEADRWLTERMNTIRSYLVALGDPIMNTGGIGSLILNFGTNILVFCPLLVFTFGADKKLQFSCQRFIRFPLIVLEEVNRQIEDLVSGLANSMRDYQSNIRLRETHKLLNHLSKSELEKVNESGRKRGSILRSGSSSYDYLSFSQDLHKILYQIRRLHLVIPYNYSSRGHLVLSRLNFMLLVVSQIEGLILTAVFILTFNYYELKSRVRIRLESLNQQESTWIHQDCFIESNFQLPKLTDQKHLHAYSNFTNQASQSGSAQYELMLVELENFVNWKVILFWFEIFMMVLLDLQTCVLYTTAYYQEVILRGLWARNLVMQIKCCIDRLIKKHSEAAPEEENADKLLLERCLLITYLNYNLFLKGHKAHQAMMHISIITIGSITTASMLLTYFSRHHFSTSTTICSALIATGCLFIFDIFLLLATAYVNENTILMALINRLIVVASLYSMEGSYIIDLFRRLILSNREQQEFYAPALFGFRVSYGNVFYLNFYMGILWYIVG